SQRASAVAGSRSNQCQAWAAVTRSAASEGKPVYLAERRWARTETEVGARAVLGAEVALRAGLGPGTGDVAAAINSSKGAMGAQAVVVRALRGEGGGELGASLPAGEARLGATRDRRHRRVLRIGHSADFRPRPVPRAGPRPVPRTQGPGSS